MVISTEKREFLVGLGYSTDQLGKIEEIATKLEKSRKAKGTLVREVTEPVVDEVPVVTQSQGNSSLPLLDKDVLMKELVDGLLVVLKPMQDAIVELKANQLVLQDTLETNLTKQLVATTPKLSLGELLMKGLGDQSRAVDGRTALGKSQPSETVLPPTSEQGLTGIPFLNGILSKQMAQ